MDTVLVLYFVFLRVKGGPGFQVNMQVKRCAESDRKFIEGCDEVPITGNTLESRYVSYTDFNFTYICGYIYLKN